MKATIKKYKKAIMLALAVVIILAGSADIMFKGLLHDILTTILNK